MVECVDFIFSSTKDRPNNGSTAAPPGAAGGGDKVERHWVGATRRARKRMPVEIEAKFKVDSFDALRERLRARGATFVGDHLETNMFFDTEDRSLLASDKGLRLRVSRDLSTAVEKYVLTYKGPRQHGTLKSRDENEIVVGNAADAATLLDRLGFSRVLSFEKKRQTWKLDRCTVELDEVPFLGLFLEIEGPGEAAVLKVRDALGLSDSPILKGSYVALLTTYLQERGDDQREITFADSAND
jgi:adenylate cyclase, class 2